MLDKVIQGFRFSYETFQSVRSSESSRNFFDLVSFAFGFIGLHNITKQRYFEFRHLSKTYDQFPLLQQRAFKVADLSGNISLILSATRSAPAKATWKWMAQVLFSSQQLERFFGQAGTVPGNTVDRSIAKLAFLLSIPSTLKTMYAAYVRLKVACLKEEKEVQKVHPYLTPRIEDFYLTTRTISRTASQLLRTPRK